MCRAIKVLCVAPDADTLSRLKRAVVAAEWELCTGAISERDALDQIDTERPHVLVAFGPQRDLIARARERSPAMRIVTDRGDLGATAVAGSLEEVRDIVRSTMRPGGPVR